jgi:YidC/Oxa1 family membrane protein insertase
MIGYTIWMTPSQEQLAKQQRIKDSIAIVQQHKIDSIRLQQVLQAEQDKKVEINTVETVYDTTDASSNYQELKEIHSIFANSFKGDQIYYTIETDKVIYKISNKGGFIKSVQLKDYQSYDSLPLIIFNPESVKFDLAFFVQNKLINTEKYIFRHDDTLTTSYTVNGSNTLNFNIRLYADAAEGVIDRNRFIEYSYVFSGDNYMLDMTINIVNLQGQIASNISSIDLNWYADLNKQEISVDQFNGSTIYYKFLQDDVDYLSETEDDELQIKTRLKWVSFKQRFFSSTIIAKESFENANIKSFELEKPPYERYLKSMDVVLELPLNRTAQTSVPLAFYFGPNKFYTLKSYGLELERQIPIGWGFFLMAWINQYIVIPVFDWLGGYGWNYGIVILVLTLLLKVVLFPIAYKTYLSSAKMRVLKPEVDELSKKYPKKEDAMQKQQAVMSLYRKAGANPASGCVPMLLQMPILFAMFRFFPSSIELRQQPFLWATDLSSYDSIMSLPFTIPFYGDHVSLFTLLMTVSTIMYTYMNNQMMGAQATQLPGMKTMMYIMPVMFLGIFNSYASGLSYYYFLANMITFGQMFIFRYSINEDKLRAKIEANKKKPEKKKSAFQKRLEEAAKQRGLKH